MTRDAAAEGVVDGGAEGGGEADGAAESWRSQAATATRTRPMEARESLGNGIAARIA